MVRSLVPHPLGRLALALTLLISPPGLAQTCKIPTLEPGPVIPLGIPDATLLPGDMNGDGLTDIVAVNGTDAYVLLSRGGGVFDPPVPYLHGGASPLLKDMDRDGLPDLVVRRTEGILVARNDGKGGFGPTVTLDFHGVFAVGDVNGDGNQDVIGREDAGFNVFLGDGKGNFSAPVLTPNPRPGWGLDSSGIAAGDLNGDGRDDVVGSGFKVYLSSYFGLTHGELQFLGTTSTFYHPFRPLLADVNGNGALDAIVRGETSPVSVGQGLSIFYGDGHGGLAPGSFPIPGCQRAFSEPLVADLDGDGANEFMVEIQEGCSGGGSTVLQVFRSESFFGQPVLTPLWRGVQSFWSPSFVRLQLDPGAIPVLAAGQASGGNLQLFRTVLANCPSPPTPLFEFSPAAPVKGQRVSFTDRSAGDPANWFWDFGDGTTAFGKDPLHAYSKAGSYDVTMTVSNAGGMASRSTRIIVSADPSFLAGFSLVPPNPVEGQPVKFVDQTTGLPTTWTWDFGDNTTGSGRNPVHAYDRAGTYTASLTISDGPLTSTFSRPVTVLPRSAQLLLLGGRIGVAVTWRSQYSGETGIAAPLPQSDLFGYFAFSSPTNPEVFVKALDFGFQSPYLVFFSGLTDYEYTVTFTNLETGQSLTFLKPAGSYSGGADNTTLTRTASNTSAHDNVLKVAEGLDLFPVLADEADEALRSPPSVDADTALYLSGGNVRVQVSWRSQYSGTTGQASAIPKADEFGYFYFSDANNPEVFVKVLDFGAASPYLLFFGGLTDFEYTVTFTNVRTGKAVSFKKEAGSYAGGADNKGLLH